VSVSHIRHSFREEFAHIWPERRKFRYVSRGEKAVAVFGWRDANTKILFRMLFAIWHCVSCHSLAIFGSTLAGDDGTNEAGGWYDRCTTLAFDGNEHVLNRKHFFSFKFVALVMVHERYGILDNTYI
jgi:hypothetical protein